MIQHRNRVAKSKEKNVPICKTPLKKLLKMLILRFTFVSISFHKAFEKVKKRDSKFKEIYIM